MIYMKTKDILDNSVFHCILVLRGFQKKNKNESRINLCMK